MGKQKQWRARLRCGDGAEVVSMGRNSLLMSWLESSEEQGSERLHDCEHQPGVRLRKRVDARAEGSAGVGNVGSEVDGGVAEVGNAKGDEEAEELLASEHGVRARGRRPRGCWETDARVARQGLSDRASFARSRARSCGFIRLIAKERQARRSECVQRASVDYEQGECQCCVEMPLA